MVPERGGAPLQQIFLSRNGAPVNFVYHSQLILKVVLLVSYLMHEICPIGSQENH